jgi:prepilin-type N-terminal cleavage/methylation domain-containing protein
MKTINKKNPPVINDIPLNKGDNELASRGIRKAGFTLVELIIVITILAILATIAFISFQNFTKDARDGNRITTLKNIET